MMDFFPIFSLLKNFFRFLFVLTNLVLKEEYQPQSGTFGKSKYQAKQHRQLTQGKRQLENISQKIRQSPNSSDKSALRVAHATISKKNKKYTHQSGYESGVEESKSEPPSPSCSVCSEPPEHFEYIPSPASSVGPDEFDDEEHRHRFNFRQRCHDIWWCFTASFYNVHGALPRFLILAWARSVLSVFHLVDFLESSFWGLGNVRNFCALRVSVASQLRPAVPFMARQRLNLAQLTFDASTVNNLENLVTLIVGLATSTNATNATVILVSHFKLYHNRSMVDSLMKLCSGYLKQTELEQQSSEDMRVLLRDSLKNWQKFKNSKFVSKLVDLLAILVGSTMCGIMNVNYNIAGIPVFGEGLKKRLDSLNVLDTAELVAESISYFLDIGYLCFTQQSIKPILYTDAEAYEMDMKYVKYYSAFPAAYDADWDSIEYTEATYKEDAEILIAYLTALHAVTGKGPEKNAILQKLLLVEKIKLEMIRVINAGGMRVAPFAMIFYGTSSVGKTSFASIINTVAVKMCDGTGDPASRITYNENDSFFSNFRDNETIVSDDMCQTHPDFMQASPLSVLIKWINNNPELAVMADLSSKGKLALRPKTVVVTTNVSNLNAHVYSVEPNAVLRRFNLHFTIKVRPAFAMEHDGHDKMMDPNKAREYVATLSDADREYPDLWDVTVSQFSTRPSSVAGRGDEGFFKPVIGENGEPMVDVSVKEVCQYVAKAARKHYLSQVDLVRGQSTIHKRVNVCLECASMDFACKCKTTEVQSGTTDRERKRYFYRIPQPPEGSFGAWRKWAFDVGADALTVYLSTRFAFIAEGEFLMSIVHLMSYFVGITPMWTLTYMFNFFLVSSSMLTGVLWSLVIMPLITAALNAVWEYIVIPQIRNCPWYVMGHIGRAFRAEVDNIQEVVNRSRALKCAIKLAVSYFAIWSIVRTIMALIQFKRVMEENSALRPDSQEYEARRSTPNVWAPTPEVKLPGTHASATTSWKDLVKLAGRNSVHVTSDRRVCGGFMLKTHFLLLPDHFLKEDGVITVKTHESDGNNTYQSSCHVSLKKSFHFKGTDLRLFYCPTGGDFRDLTSFLPDTEASGSWVCSFIHRLIDGTLLHDTTLAVADSVVVADLAYKGFKYTLNTHTTYKGMCMAVLINEAKSPKLIGFHLGGVPNTRHGVAGTIDRKSVMAAVDSLCTVGVWHPPDTAPVDPMAHSERRNGVPFATLEPLSHQCATRYLPEGASVRVIAKCEGASSFHSQAMLSHICETVEEVCGVPRVYGPPPHMKKWEPWQKAMAGFATISTGPNVELLARASEDYFTEMVRHMGPEVPLDPDTCLNGRDGDKFINRMPQNTSVGFPLSGPLGNFCTLLTPTDDHSTRYVLDSDLLAVVEQYEERLAAGVRIMSVFRASQKDESVSKAKRRIFQAAPVTLKLLLRKYFLPIVARLSMFPLDSECAVGINPFSEEWDEMHDHIVDNGEENIVAGDYSAYDQRISPAITSAAFDILIRLAEVCGYSARDLRIMRSLANEVVYPVIAFNGTLVQVLGSNPSGHNITVYVNSIANSLISRCAFFNVYPEVESFRSAVSMMTYGDDDIGSVGSAFPLYNNISKSDYINSIGMKYTPPTKVGDHVTYLSMGEVDFLKRKSTWNEEKGRYMGALEMDSIYKSLHCRMWSSDVCDEQWAGSVVDAAMREMYPRGREAYAEFQNKMTIVADRHEFRSHCRTLGDSYEICGAKIG